MKVSVAVLLLCVAAVSAWEKPDSCRGDECPEYTVIKSMSNEDYEVREYVASRWVATGYRATNIFTKFTKMNSAFMKLFQYISGSNMAEAKIEMTRPVRTTVNSCAQTDCSKKTHEMAFFMPLNNTANTPAPFSPEVEIIDVPAATYYVRSFSGYMYERGYDRELRKLKQSIGDENAYDGSYHINAGYNSPMEWSDRHNEVMLEMVSN